MAAKAAVERTRFDGAEKTILFFSSASHFFTHFYMFVFPALVMPMSRDLGLPLSSVLELSFWMYLVYGLVALGWGWISDHWGHKWALGSGVLLSGLGFVAAGLADSFAALSLSFAVVGVGCSAYHPSGTAIVSQGIRQRGRAMGIIGIWGNAGMAVAPFVAGLLNLVIGWRTGVVVIGLMGAALGVLALITPFAVERGSDRKVVGALKKGEAGRLFVVFCIGLIFAGLMYRSFMLLLPAFLEARLGGLLDSLQSLVRDRYSSAEKLAAFKPFSATVAATVIYMIGISGQLLGGWAADRFSLKWTYLIFFVSAVPFIVGMALIPGPALVASACVFVIFTHGMQPIENSLIAYLTPARWRSVSYGVKFTLSFGAGAFAVKLAGAATDAYGIEKTIWIVPVFVILVIVNTVVFLYLSRGRDLRH